MPNTPRSPMALARPASSALARPHTWGYRRNSGGRRKLSPRAFRRAAEDFSSVEPLSPMAPPDALAAASYGCSAVRLFSCSAVRLFGCSAVRLFGCSAVRLSSCGDFTLRSIGDNRSTKKPSSVEPLSPMALHDAQRRRLTAVRF